jgi:murein L,D-transpeptidase YafK
MCFALVQNAAWADIDFVRVIKSQNKLQLMESGTVKHEFHAVFGENPKGHKQQEGDKKTPEGLYTLDYKKENSSYFKAIHVSYPNATDTEAAKKRNVSPGGQIMIHGQKNGFGWLSSITQRFNWTNDCIALSNNDMQTVWRLVKVGTPIEIKP